MNFTPAFQAALVGVLAVALDVGGQDGEGGDVEGEGKEEEQVGEEEGPDEAVLEVQKGLRQGVLEQVLEPVFVSLSQRSRRYTGTSRI